MIVILIVVAALFLTILAFALKSDVFTAPMLHGVSILIWMIATWMLVTNALNNYPGTYIPTAVGLFGMTMVIVHTVAVLLPYLRGRRSDHDVYNERQAAYKIMIAGKTRRPSNKDIWR